MLMMHAAAGIADQIGGVALPLGPADARPHDRGHVAAVQTRHMEIPLIAVEIGRLDAGMAFQRGRGHHVNLAPPPEGGGVLDRQIDGIAFAIGIARIPASAKRSV